MQRDLTSVFSLNKFYHDSVNVYCQYFASESAAAGLSPSLSHESTSRPQSLSLRLMPVVQGHRRRPEWAAVSPSLGGQGKIQI